MEEPLASSLEEDGVMEAAMSRAVEEGRTQMADECAEFLRILALNVEDENAEVARHLRAAAFSIEFTVGSQATTGSGS